MTRYRIESQPFIHAPGFVRWLREAKPHNAVDLWQALGFSSDLAVALVNEPKSFSVEVEGETVIISDLRTPPDPQDITGGKHGGSEESNAAFALIKDQLRKNQQKVYDQILDTGKNGLTCRQLAERWQVPMHKISGRFSELKKVGLIRKIGTVDKSALCVATEIYNAKS